MAKHLPSITHLLRDKFHHSGGKHFGTPRNLLGDWKVLLSIFALAILIVIVLSVLIFMRASSGSTVGGESATTTPLVETFNKQELLRAADALRERNSRNLELGVSAPEIADPSN